MNKSQVPAVGDEFLTQVDRLNDDGDGVARTTAGMTVFVPDLLPGESAEVVLTEVEKRFARARVVARKGTSPLREQPVCSVFGECGGCQLQHVAYAAQLRHKQSIIEYTLRPSAGFNEVRVLPTLGMEFPFRYRNQVQVAVRYEPNRKRYAAGFFAPASHEIVETAQCQLEPLEMEQTVQKVLSILNEASDSRAFLVHHLIVRQSFTNGEEMVILALGRALDEKHEVVRRITELPQVVSLGQTVQPRPHGPVWGPTVELLQGVPHLRERLGDLEFLISPRSFFQVNTEQALRLYERVRDYAQVAAEDTVLDAYCGTGTISLFLAATARRVVGIESIGAAIEDARLNAEHNRVNNVEFVIGEVERVLPKRLASGESFDVVILDPPRRGCHPDVLASVIAAKPRRIVYVSCNHATLARDLKALMGGGFEVVEAQPVDMFPQTNHVETCVLLVRSAVTP